MTSALVKRTVSNPWVQTFFTGLLLLLTNLNSANYWASHWYLRWSLLFLISGASWIVWLRQRLSWQLLPIIIVSMASGWYVSLWPSNHYLTMVPSVLFLELCKNAFYASTVVVLATTLCSLPKAYFRPVSMLLAAEFIIVVSSTLLPIPFLPWQKSLFLGNPSMNGCLIACLLPLAVASTTKARIKWLFVTSALVAVSLIQKHVPFGCLGIAVCAYIAAKKLSIRQGMILTVAASLAVTGGVACCLSWPESFAPSGRDTIWRQAFGWWGLHMNPLAGSGIGSAQVLLPEIQRMYLEPGRSIPDYFLWLHSDWIQCLFELGYPGLVSAMLAYFYLLHKAWKTPYLFASLSAFGGFAMFNYPLRLVQTCVPLMLVCWLILQETGQLPRQRQEHKTGS